MQRFYVISLKLVSPRGDVFFVTDDDGLGKFRVTRIFIERFSFIYI